MRAALDPAPPRTRPVRPGRWDALHAERGWARSAGVGKAEWTKLRTLPGTGWLLLGAVAATVIVSAIVSASLFCTSSAGCHPDVTKLSLSGAGLGVLAAWAAAALLAGALLLRLRDA